MYFKALKTLFYKDAQRLCRGVKFIFYNVQGGLIGALIASMQ